MQFKKHDFEGYRTCGLKLDVNYAIDLTISNGDIRKGEASLHALEGHDHSTVYTRIMKEFGQKLAPYEGSNSVNKVFGFGAIPQMTDEVSHLIDFENFNTGIDNAILSYQNMIHQVQFHGPTHYSSIIDFVNNK